jgi:peptidoglycan/LPS O-acetylase OafA/YrhL
VSTEASRLRPFWHLEGGDAIRAAACLGIVCFHVATGALFISGNLAGSGGEHTWVDGYGELGRIALESASTGFYVFFVLSGFLVAAPFVGAFVEGRPRPRLAPYFRNRAVRLVPAAWLLFVFVIARHGTRGESWNELLAMFTFTEDHVDDPLTTLVGQTWTIRVDMCFYILVPIASALAVRSVGRRLGVVGRRRAVWAGAAAVSAVTLTVSGLVVPTTGATRSPTILLFLFMPGVALAALLAGRRPSLERPYTRLTAAAVSLLGGFVLIAYPRSLFGLPIRLAIVGCGAGMLVGGLVLLERRTGRTWAWMRSSPVRWVGRRTYGIYLWHLAVMAELAVLFEGAQRAGRTYAVLLPLVVLATLAVSAISFRFVERPAMRLRHSGPRATAAAEQAPPAAAVPAVAAAASA